MRKKRQIHSDLPKRSDPNYMKLWSAKHKSHLKGYRKKRIQKVLEDNPEYYKVQYSKEKERYDRYRTENRATLQEKAWKKQGIVDMTTEKFDIEFKKQEGKCKICGEEMNKPHVDHDHKTGLFRGLLCVPCNNGLGIYEKNKERFEHYLNNFSKIVI